MGRQRASGRRRGADRAFKATAKPPLRPVLSRARQRIDAARRDGKGTERRLQQEQDLPALARLSPPLGGILLLLLAAGRRPGTPG